MDTPSHEPPPPPPSGLLALILLPLQSVLSIGLSLFAALVSGILGSVIPHRVDRPDEEPED